MHAQTSVLHMPWLLAYGAWTAAMSRPSACPPQQCIPLIAGKNLIASGDTIYLKANTGKYIDINGTALQARWTGQEQGQPIMIELDMGYCGFIRAGDTISLAAYDGNVISISDTVVQATQLEGGSSNVSYNMSHIIIENEGGGMITAGDVIYLSGKHSGKHIDIAGMAVQARWTDRREGQQIIIENDHPGVCIEWQVHPMIVLGQPFCAHASHG